MNREAVPAQRPGSPRSGYPGYRSELLFNPEGVVANLRAVSHNPFGVDSNVAESPRVGALRQPWALGRNRFAVLGARGS